MASIYGIFSYAWGAIGAFVYAVAEFSRMAAIVAISHFSPPDPVIKAVFYRIIDRFKPEYQASYDSHGLSVDHRMRC